MFKFLARRTLVKVKVQLARAEAELVEVNISYGGFFDEFRKVANSNLKTQLIKEIEHLQKKQTRLQAMVDA